MIETYDRSFSKWNLHIKIKKSSTQYLLPTNMLLSHLQYLKSCVHAQPLQVCCKYFTYSSVIGLFFSSTSYVGELRTKESSEAGWRILYAIQINLYSMGCVDDALPLSQLSVLRNTTSMVLIFPSRSLHVWVPRIYAMFQLSYGGSSGQRVWSIKWTSVRPQCYFYCAINV